MKQFYLKSNQNVNFLILLGDVNNSFFGHVMSRGSLENIVTAVKIEGKRDGRRQRE
jgi:hypothetical protein